MLELFKRLHRDERGSLSIESILIIAAISVPVILFVYKIGWPAIRDMFEKGMTGINPDDIYGEN